MTRLLAEILTLSVFVMAAFCVAGYILDLPALRNWLSGPEMALPTATCLLCLSSAQILFALHHEHPADP